MSVFQAPCNDPRFVASWIYLYNVGIDTATKTGITAYKWRSLQIDYNTLYIGMDVHKETFSLCCYDMQQDKVFHAQKMEADYNQILNYLNAVRKAIGDDVQFVCGYEAGCLGFTLHHQLTRYGVNCVIWAPTTMSKPAGKKKIKTDKRAAENIASCLAYHTYSPVHISTEQDKQVKEYLRMRDDHHPHYLSAFLSRLPCACFTSFAPKKPDLPM